MTKPVGPVCNLDCTYCFYLEKEKLYPAARGVADWRMRDDVLEAYVRQYLASQPGPTVTFAWQGGEPTLLGVDFFRRVVALQRQHAGGRAVENTLQTNAVKLDDEWGAFLAEHGFLVGVSIDGPRELHDRHRMDTLTVVNRHNADRPLEVYRFLREIGSGFIQLIPVVERVAAAASPDGLELVQLGHRGEARVTDWSVGSEQYGRFLCAVFDEWVRRDVGTVFVQVFDEMLASWLGVEPSLCVFRPTCGGAMAMEHNGDLYSCDHFVYPEHKLGNLLETPIGALARSAQQRAFGEAKRDALPAYCRSCDYRFACHGECPKKRFLRTPDGEEGLNYLCAGYKRFFAHIDPYMRYMAGELRERRPASGVMAWAGWRDVRAAGRREPGRNDDCPCGSGRKYKRCCAAGGEARRATSAPA
jgi:uncharacterized protein